ncbi:MAG: MBL fold metallo-hydrolase [Micropepsaceae bacterium]
MKKLLFAALLSPSIAMAGDALKANPVQDLSPGVHFLQGSIQLERGPDGNTVMFEAPEGLVAIDTGRHAWHSDAILDFASSHRLPVPVIVNTHWHLDHSSGNIRIKAAHPEARLFATSAVDLALAPNGFLMREFARMPRYLKQLDLTHVQRDEIDIAMKTMAHREFLRPDVPVNVSGTLRLAGRVFDVHVTQGAVTDADLWLYEPESKIAVLGDLVTFPAPFLETACPKRWREALDDVAAVPFTTAIPGHGAPMSKPQFDTYRHAFGQFVDCANSSKPADACASGWASDVSAFLADEKEKGAAASYASYYVGFLRSNKGKSPDCRRE